MVEKNGEDIDWLHDPFDSVLMHDCADGMPHGYFAVANGAFDSESVQLTCVAKATHEFQGAKQER